MYEKRTPIANPNCVSRKVAMFEKRIALPELEPLPKEEEIAQVDLQKRPRVPTPQSPTQATNKSPPKEKTEKKKPRAKKAK